MRLSQYAALSRSQGQPENDHLYMTPVNALTILLQLYFGRDFSWEMAQEADCIAWNLHKAEQAAQRNKGKGKGQPDSTAAVPQTFDV